LNALLPLFKRAGTAAAAGRYVGPKGLRAGVYAMLPQILLATAAGADARTLDVLMQRGVQ
jgi:hypothetical protein